MELKDYKEMIAEAIYNADHGDIKFLDRIAESLQEADDAKQVLRDKGYGWNGLSLLETVQAVEDLMD